MALQACQEAERPWCDDCDGSAAPSTGLEAVASGVYHSDVPATYLGWDVLCGPDRDLDGRQDIAVLGPHLDAASSADQFAVALAVPEPGHHEITSVADLTVSPTGRASFRHLLGMASGGGLLLPPGDNQLHAPAFTELVHASSSGRVSDATPAWGREDGTGPPDDPITGAYTGPVDLTGDGLPDHAFGGVVFEVLPDVGFALHSELEVGTVRVSDPVAALDAVIDSAVGDLDGDGSDDLVLAYQYDPWVVVAFGPIGGAPHVAPGPRTAQLGPASRDPDLHRAQSVAVGDVTGDGIDDLVVGDKWYDGQRGAAYVWAGPIGVGTQDTSSAVSVIVGEVGGATMGSQVTVADVDGDGIDGLVVSASYRDQPFPGLVYLFEGPLQRGTIDAASATRVLRGEEPGAMAGFALEACDLDGDGQDELVIGAPGQGRYDPNDRSGVVYWVD